VGTCLFHIDHFVVKGLVRQVSILLLCVFLTLGASASDSLGVSKQMDLIDLGRIIFHVKSAKATRRLNEIGGKGPFFSGIILPSYALATGISVAATGNISFRTKHDAKCKLSYFNNILQYTQYNQIVATSVSDIYIKGNKWQFPGEIRFFKFPTQTYGLGSESYPSSADNINYSHFRFYRRFLRMIAADSYIGLGYNLDHHWQISDQNADLGFKNDWVKYGYKKRTTSSGLSVNFMHDSRSDENQPLFGAYLDIKFVSYLKVMGSDNNWNSVVIDMRKYMPLTRRWYAEVAVWGYIWLTLNGHAPYLDLPSLGWDPNNNMGRGYAAGRYRGRNMLYVETELRFDILRNGFLGGVIFGNLQTFSQYPDKYFGYIQPGTGAGLRIKFNKRTHSNGCIDYGFGSHGSRGFATNLNEVF
jgi:hypothetical protein